VLSSEILPQWHYSSYFSVSWHIGVVPFDVWQVHLFVYCSNLFSDLSMAKGKISLLRTFRKLEWRHSWLWCQLAAITQLHCGVLQLVLRHDCT